MESKELEAHIKETDLKLSKQLLLNIKDRFMLAGLNCTAISLYGDVRETLAEQILEIHPDFVIIGTHGEGKTIGIIGSVSKYLVHHLPIPVTLIKNKEF
jgi:nucleotide-binding universal stress UspA family protein